MSSKKKGKKKKKKSKAVAVIGAGLAGLSCARRLGELGFDVKVYEQQSVPGGRVKSAHLGNYRYEQGAQCFVVKDGLFQLAINEWVEEGVAARWDARFGAVREGGITGPIKQKPEKISAQAELVNRKLAKLNSTGYPSGSGSGTVSGSASASYSASGSDAGAHYVHGNADGLEIDKSAVYVGVPNNAAVIEFMASKVDVTYNTRVAHVRLIKDRTKWMLFTDDDTVDAEFDSVVLALPAPQLIHVLTTKYWSAAAILSAASNVVFSPCTALVAVFPQGTMLAEFELDYAIAQKSHVIASLSRETSKPRVANSYYSADSVSSDDVDLPEDAELWVIKATGLWSENHMRQDDAWIRRAILKEFFKLVGVSSVDPLKTRLLRWPFEKAKPLNQRYLYNADINVGVCGDWCGGPRSEGAYLSGLKLANTMAAARSSKVVSFTDEISFTRHAVADLAVDLEAKTEVGHLRFSSSSSDGGGGTSASCTGASGSASYSGTASGYGSAYGSYGVYYGAYGNYGKYNIYSNDYSSDT